MEVSVIRSISNVNVSPSNHGALYAAFMATLISILLTRFRNVILAYWRSPATSTAISSTDFDDDLSDLDDDEDDNGDELSVSSSEDEDGEPGTPESDEEIKMKLRREFSWSDFGKGRSVVRLLDGIGLGLDLNKSSGSLISIYDLGSEQRIVSVFDKCKFPSIIRPPPSPSVIISTRRNSFTNCDSRSSFKLPSIVAEWDEVRPSNGNRAPGLLLGGVKTVYVGDSVSGVVTVSDARKTVSDVQTWWDVE